MHPLKAGAGVCGPARAPAGAQGGPQGAGGALGITAKSSAAFREVLDEKTGEIQRFTLDSRRCEYVLERDPSESRTQRFGLQSAARSILKTDANPKGGKWRLSDCIRTPTGSEVAVLMTPAVQKAHFGGLATCGSVWACPVCSAKVSERRKLEIVAAADTHKSAGGGLYLVTLTWAHKRVDDLASMVKSSRTALVRLRAQRAYKDNSRKVGAVGMIRAFEVTHGDANGWHPHFHELWFVKEKLTARQLAAWKKTLFEEWWAQCARAGLGLPNRKAGITIIEAQSAAEYVAKFGNPPKWGIGSELVKHQAKHGRGGSRTPWDLLRLYAEGEGRFAHLFREYANAFFGARQVFWTPGMKAAFGIDEVSDDELARREEQAAVCLTTIPKETWREVLRQAYEARTVVLKLAESGGADAVANFLGGLRGRAAACRGEGFPAFSAVG